MKTQVGCWAWSPPWWQFPGTEAGTFSACWKVTLQTSEESQVLSTDSSQPAASPESEDKVVRFFQLWLHRTHLRGADAGALQDKCFICRTTLRVKYSNYIWFCSSLFEQKAVDNWIHFAHRGWKTTNIEIKSRFQSQCRTCIESRPKVRRDEVVSNKFSVTGDLTLLLSVLLGWVSTPAQTVRSGGDPSGGGFWLRPGGCQHTEVELPPSVW